MLSIGVEIVLKGQPIGVWTGPLRKFLHGLDRGATTSQLCLTVSLHDLRGIRPRADLPFPTGGIWSGCLSYRPPRGRVRPSLVCVDENEDSPTLAFRAQLTSADLPPDRPFAPAKPGRSLRNAQWQCQCHVTDTMSHPGRGIKGSRPGITAGDHGRGADGSDARRWSMREVFEYIELRDHPDRPISAGRDDRGRAARKQPERLIKARAHVHQR